jgi:quercetin dioxygenase-like cupin family protein
MSKDDRLLQALRSGGDEFEAAPPTPSKAPSFLRLAATLSDPTERLAPFADRLGELMDVTVETARSYLARIFDPAAWQNLMPSIDLVHLEGGPATEGADVGFVRIEPGQTFPEHRHLGDEHALILQGRVADNLGGVAGPGDITRLGVGSAHELRCVSDEPLIFAVVVHGIEMVDGTVIDADT